jgi:hypothetical protein
MGPVRHSRNKKEFTAEAQVVRKNRRLPFDVLRARPEFIEGTNG